MIGEEHLPAEAWGVRERGLDLDVIAETESIFALSNGHLGLRGNLDEGEPRGATGTYLGGFYESYPLQYGETGYGFAEDGQAVVDVTDGKLIRLLVEDEPFDVHRGKLVEHERRLDFRSGLLERRATWTSVGGRTVRITSRRLVSFEQRSVAAISYEVEAVDGPMRVALQSNLLANQSAPPEETDPRAGASLGPVLQPQLHTKNDLRVVLAHTTARTRLSLAAGMDHVIEVDDHPRTLTQAEDDLGRVTVSAQLTPGKPLRLVKMLAYHWSSQQSVEWLRDQVDASLENALAEGFDGLVEAQRAHLDRFWDVADVELDGDLEVQQGLRFALFSIYQATARAETRAIAAKGLTGTGYNGHAFWDTEAFVLPVLTYTRPELARDALRWRHSTLDLARERARQLGLHGAAFPWRTIHGEECSGYWPAGTAAFHVNAAVAQAAVRYVAVSGDDDFERDVGLELLVETARLWRSLGHHDHDGSFRIDGVTGPDEYSAVVDNNVYTNLMAQANLWAAAAAARRWPDAARALGADDEEAASWSDAGDAMFVPFDPVLGLHPQDQDFLTHQVWPFDRMGEDDYPLLLHHAYFDLYRRQVVKQADLVMAMFTRGDHFTDEQKRANFAYYETVTVRDSSLSACIQSVMATETGHVELGYDYLAEAALMDLRDLEHNVASGLHMASLGGALIAVVCGIGGFRDPGGHLAFSPRLPPGVDRVAFPTVMRGRCLRVEIGPKAATYSLEGVAGVEALDDGPLVITHWGEEISVAPGAQVSRPIPPAPQLDRPVQPNGRAPARRGLSSPP